MTKKHINMFTTEQYEVLRGVLQTNAPSPWAPKDVIEFLWCPEYLWPSNRISARSKLAFVRRPLSDMPLYINDDRLTFRTIAIWRLKISR